MTEFEQIYRAYFTDVYRYALRLTRDSSIAEDITADTFFRAMRSLGSFRGDCEISVWLCKIAKNSYFSYCKKNSRAVPTDISMLTEIPSDDAPVDERLIDHEEAAKIHEVLSGIKEPYRRVFIWRVFAHLSFKQIGKLFKKTENWACVTYHRAKNMIKSKMEDDSHGE